MTELILTELGYTQKMDLLQHYDWANDLNRVQMDTLAPYFKSYSAKAGVAILTEGKTNDLLCLLCEGKIDISKENASGMIKIIQTLGPGKIFGEISFFDRGPCSASIITKTEARLLVLHKSDFENVCTEAPAIALTITLNLIKSLGQRLRETTGKLIEQY